MFKGNNMNEEIILKSEDGVGIITLNRPERLNALTYNIVKKMNNFLDCLLYTSPSPRDNR